MHNDTMRVWRIRQSGEEGTLEMDTRPIAEPGPQQVRIRVRAAGINRADILQRKGGYPPPPGFDPAIPGMEYAGEIEQVGENAQTRQVGDKVMGLTGGCAYAEVLSVHERETIALPEGISYTDAAALPEDFLTAYRAVFLKGGLQPGQWCLVRPATSGVGIAAVQLIHALGGRVIGSSRGEDRLAKIRHFGLTAEAVDGDDGVAEQIRDITGGAGVAVVLDQLGAKKLGDNLRCLRAEDGTQVTVGLLAGAKAEVNLGAMLGNRLTLKAMRMRSLPLEGKIHMARIFEDRLAPLFASGRLQPVVDSVLPFEEAPEAHRRMEANEHCGKIVLSVGSGLQSPL